MLRNKIELIRAFYSTMPNIAINFTADADAVASEVNRFYTSLSDDEDDLVFAKFSMTHLFAEVVNKQDSDFIEFLAITNAFLLQDAELQLSPRGLQTIDADLANELNVEFSQNCSESKFQSDLWFTEDYFISINDFIIAKTDEDWHKKVIEFHGGFAQRAIKKIYFDSLKFSYNEKGK
jgi:hypothetical protein